MEMENVKIRNFSIIAHIDHGKSTLADRMIEITKAVEARKMKNQFLDKLDLERERGITIKMQPIRMSYMVDGAPFVLNLIDTPGHIDFSYEVSRALTAVEGAVLLVDATKGVQAQTFSVLQMAKDLGLEIIPVVNKIDSPAAMIPETKLEIARMLDVDQGDILETSGRSGAGVGDLLNAVIKRIPAANIYLQESPQALVFDFEYSEHKGIVVYARVFRGVISKGDKLFFVASGQFFEVKEVGVFAPDKVEKERLFSGEIGYIVTGIKSTEKATVGDTILRVGADLRVLKGYQEPKPVVWASIFPEDQGNFVSLKHALEKLRLEDSSLSFEEESSNHLGRGFKCGFLGMLHLEIATERLKREHRLQLVIATPMVKFEAVMKDGRAKEIYSANDFPDDGMYQEVKEPWVSVKILCPTEYMGDVLKLFYEHEAEVKSVDDFGSGRNSIVAEMPQRELMRNFFDELKSVTSGFASLSYSFLEMRLSETTRMDIIIGGEKISSLARVISRRQVEEEAKHIVEKLKKVLPRQMFDFKIQAQALGRIMASESVSGMKKNVTGHLYGGDITRKMKLREKQKKGKKKMKQFGKVNIDQTVFLKLMKRDE